MKPHRKQEIVAAKWRVCAFHFIHTSKDGAVIAKLARVNHRKLFNYSLTPDWIVDIRFWVKGYDGTGELKGNYFLSFVKRQKQKRTLHTSLTNLKPILYSEQGGICNGCRVHFPIENLTFDHILAKSRGGSGKARENLQLLCQPCNHLKGTGTQSELIQRLKQQGILP